MLRQIVAQIQQAQSYSLIADEATDISRLEQICATIRLVCSSYEVHEDALDLAQLPDTKAITLFNLVKDVLVQCSLPLSQCRGF